KPSTNSPMMRSTRQRSVLVNEARRSMGTTCGGMRSCSSSVSGLRGEALGCSDMVILHVIEEGREPDVARPAVGNHAAGRQVPYGCRRVRHWNHHDRRPPFRLDGDLGHEPGLPQSGDQVFGESGGGLTNPRNADLLDVLETTELGIDGRERRCSHLEAARVVVKGQRARIERELLALPEPPRDTGLEFPRDLLPDVEEYDAGTAQQPFEPAGDQRVDARCLDVYRDLADRLIRIDQTQRATCMRCRGDALDILDRAGGEVDVRR